MLDDIQDILWAISGYSVLIPLIVCVIVFKNVPRRFRAIAYFVFIATAGEIVAYLLIRTHIHSLPALHAYTLIEGIILLLVYSKLLTSKIKPTYFTITIILFTLFALFNAAFIQSIFEINSNVKTLESFLILGCAVLFYFVLLESDGDLYAFKKPLTWINNGIFLYFSMSLFFFIFGNYLLNNYSAEFNNLIWRIHTLFLIIFHLILARGIWLLGKKAAS